MWLQGERRTCRWNPVEPGRVAGEGGRAPRRQWPGEPGEPGERPRARQGLLWRSRRAGHQLTFTPGYLAAPF